MDTFKYTTTFLRSALAQDPFCLGDLGPEDVERIEAEFPELFDSEPKMVELLDKDKDSGNNFGTAVAADKPKPSTPKKALPSPKKPTDKLPLTPRRLSPVSPASKLFQSRSTGLRSSVCSRGDRCQAKPGIPNANQPQKQGLNRYPLRKAPIPRTNLAIPEPKYKIWLASRGRSEGGVSYKPANPNIAITTSSCIIPPEPIKRRTRFYPVIKSPVNTKPHYGALSRSQSNMSIPIPTTTLTKKAEPAGLKKITNIPSGPCPEANTNGNTSKSKVNESKILDFLNEVRRRAQEEQKRLEGLALISAIRKANENGSPNSSESLSKSSSTDSSSAKSKLSPQKTAIKFQNHRNSELVIPEKSDEMAKAFQDEPLIEIEQLVITKLLAEKYELAGKLQRKSTTKPKTIKSSKEEETRKKNEEIEINDPIPRIPAHKTLIEKITQDLIRAEILNCIHFEDMNRKIDVGIETEPNEITETKESVASVHETKDLKLKVDVGIGTESDLVFGLVEKLLKNETMKKALSTISEESEKLIGTTELTSTQPSDDINNQQPAPAESQAKIVPVPVANSECKSKSIIPTPEQPELIPSSSKKNRTQVIQKKSIPSIVNDATDCSSISDFTFSEDEKLMSKQDSLSLSKHVFHGDEEVLIETLSKSSNKNNNNSSTFSHKNRQQQKNNVVIPSEQENLSKKYELNNNNGRNFENVNKETQTSKTNSKPSRSNSNSKSKVSSTNGFTTTDLDVLKRLVGNDVLSEGEFLLTPYKSNGEISLSNSFSPGLYLGDANECNLAENGGGGGDFCSTRVGMQTKTQNGLFNDDDYLSDGEAPTTTDDILAMVNGLLNKPRVST